LHFADYQKAGWLSTKAEHRFFFELYVIGSGTRNLVRVISFRKSALFSTYLFFISFEKSQKRFASVYGN